MAKKKIDLSKEELEIVSFHERTVGEMLDILKGASKFQKGDFLIAFNMGNIYSESQKRLQIMTSYGAPKKFIVVHSDKHGIPYIKELNRNGEPAGTMFATVRLEGTQFTIDKRVEFEIDPDYADAIILNDQENYNPADIMKAKSDAFKAIGIHNKSIKVATDPQVLPIFIATVKVGDILWRSNVTSWSIIEVNNIPRTASGRIEWYKPFIKANTNNGKEINLSLSEFSGKALYSSRPRTYRELKDPK